MRLIFKIARRNIQRHKGKSLVVGIILFLGAFIMTIGNGVISGMEKGLRENIMNRFTGQVVVVSDQQTQDIVIFTPMGKDVEVIAGYDQIKKILESQTYIDRFLPLGKGFTLVLNEFGDPGYTLALGVNFDEYQKMFNNNIRLVEGKLLKGDDRGLLVTKGNRKKIFDESDFWVIPEGGSLIDKNLTDEAKKNKSSLDIRENIVLMGSSSENTTMDLRLPVKGIVEFEFLDDYWNIFNIMDIESFREVFHYVTAEDAKVQIAKDKKKILESENLDDMFGDDMVQKNVQVEKKYDVTGLMGKKVTQKKAGMDSGAYNLVFVKLKNPDAIDPAVESLNKAFKAAKAGARAITWKQAVGQLADMATIMRGAAMGFVLLIFVVAIIIIMNTLSMAAIQRISEIGMMRAVGAQKSFIAGMFFAETTIISGIFGGAGIIFGIIAIYVLNLMNITTDNKVLQLLFGGRAFHPLIGMSDIIVGIIELGLVTLLAVLYPLSVARKITPLDAIMRD